MPNFRETRECLLHCYSEDLISDEEFYLLYDINKSKNRDFEFWRYQKLNLNLLSDDDVFAEFRFMKHDITRMAEVLNIPNEITCHFYNDLKVDGVEALCVVLKRLAYPCRYVDMIPRFGRAVPQLCMIFNQTIDLIDRNWGHLLERLDQLWLSPDCLMRFAEAVHRRGAALGNVWGFIDGTVRACSRPKVNQRVLYNGHKRHHALKYQSVSTPSGMIANLYGPVEGKRHDYAMLAMSGLLQALQQHSYGPNGELLCIYGDPAYPLRQHLLSPYAGAQLTQQQKDFNKSMSKARVSVEWMFGEIVEKFKFVDFKKNLKVGLTSAGKIYRVSAILTNAHACLYKNIVSEFYGIEPPTLEQYFQ